MIHDNKQTDLSHRGKDGEEVFQCHRGRHPTRMRIRTGFTKDDRITGMHYQSLLDGGAYGSYGVASTYYTGALQTVTYEVPAYRFDGVRAFTNKAPCGPKRGHGTPWVSTRDPPETGHLSAKWLQRRLDTTILLLLAVSMQAPNARWSTSYGCSLSTGPGLC